MTGALDLLLSPVHHEEFFRDHWERRPLRVPRDDAEHYAPLFSAGDLPQVIAEAAHAMRHQAPGEVPILEIIARAEDPRAVSASPTVAEVDAAFAAGATVRLNHLPLYWTALRSYVRQLESELGFVVGVSAYCSPGDSRGAGLHFDEHDTAVMQIAGTKRWRFGPGPSLPLEKVPLLPFESRTEMRRHRLPPPVFTAHVEMEEVLLGPGDFLYLPRGFLHDVQAVGTFTVHLTFGIQQITWIDFLGALAAEAGLRDPRLRRSIPPRHHRTAPEAMRGAAEEALAALAESASPANTFHSIGTVWSAVAKPPLWTAEAELRPRWLRHRTPDLSCEDTGAEVALVSGTTRLLGPPSYAEAFRFIAASPSFAVEDIPLPPGEQLSIARRLVREGLYSSHP